MVRMKLLKNIFTGLIAVVFTTTACFGASKCDSAAYRRAYPKKCQTYNNSTLLALAGGVAFVGATLSATAHDNHDSSYSISTPRTTSSDNFVKNQRISAHYIDSLTNGSDIDHAVITNIQQSAQYQKNYKQYNAINFAYANARGFTGKNSNINILDDFYGDHGNTVNYILHNVAPDAHITNYNIAVSENTFKSFDSIADTINTATPANIYNASWQIPAKNYINAATVIYNKNSPKTYTEAQRYLYNITSQKFINQILTTAIDNDAIFVWAAGNESLNESGALSAMPIAFPELDGHFVNVIALNNLGQIAWYSNQCGITQNYCIAAPGSGWKTDTQSYASGTSFAAPTVSGAIATIKEAFPYMTASQITSLLFATATDLGEPGIDAVYGWGLLNMEAATKPVGTPKIVLSNNTIQPLGVSNVSGSVAAALQSANIKIAFLDDFGRAFTTNLSDNINIIPYGRGFDKLREREKDSIVLFDSFEFGFKQNHLLESSGFMSIKENQITNFIGYKNAFSFKNIDFYQNVRMGAFSQKPDNNSIVSGFSNIYTSSAKIGAMSQDFGLEIAIPDTIISGDMYLNIPIARADNGDIIYENKNINLVTNPSIEYTMKYKYLSATYVHNPSFQDEVFIMAKTKFEF